MVNKRHNKPRPLAKPGDIVKYKTNKGISGIGVVSSYDFEVEDFYVVVMEGEFEFRSIGGLDVEIVYMWVALGDSYEVILSNDEEIFIVRNGGFDI